MVVVSLSEALSLNFHSCTLWYCICHIWTIEIAFKLHLSCVLWVCNHLRPGLSLKDNLRLLSRSFRLKTPIINLNTILALFPHFEIGSIALYCFESPFFPVIIHNSGCIDLRHSQVLQQFDGLVLISFTWSKSRWYAPIHRLTRSTWSFPNKGVVLRLFL